MDPRARLQEALAEAHIKHFGTRTGMSIKQRDAQVWAIGFLDALDPAILSALLDGLALASIEDWSYKLEYDRRRGFDMTLPPRFYKKNERDGTGSTIHEAIASMGEAGS